MSVATLLRPEASGGGYTEPSTATGGGGGRSLPPALAAPSDALPPRPENIKAFSGATKIALGLVPPVFKVAVALAMQFGARKYAPWNWRDTAALPVRASTYVSAMQRHLDAWQSGEDCAADSGVSHLGHLAASCAILLDAIEAGHFVDDRADGLDIAAAHARAEAIIKAWPPAKHDVFG